MANSVRSPLLVGVEKEEQYERNVRSGDLPPIESFPQFARESWIELKKLWALSWPAVITILCQYGIGSVTQIFSGQLGSLDLAAVSIGMSVITGFSFGFMLGMGSALETLCGQSFGAGQLHMLGVYMQRSWIILTVTALLLSPVYIFAAPIVKLLGQADDISDLTGTFSIWTLPLLFAFAINFPVQKFLQSQSKVKAMAAISSIGLIVHVFVSWLCILKLGWGLVGAAISVNIICMNLNGWEAMIFIGINAAISVRVSNELGAGHPKATQFSVIIVVATSLLIGIICMVIVLLAKDKFAVLFTDSEVVRAAVSKLAILLAVTMLLNSVHPVLSGVAVGGGWQALIAYINLGCYYVVGVPVGILLGYKFNLGLKGIWSGMIGGTALQTIVLLLIVYFTNWEKETSAAEDHIKLWGGSVEVLKNSSVDERTPHRIDVNTQ